jgi:Cyclic nucleotide-binding domain
MGMQVTSIVGCNLQVALLSQLPVFEAVPISVLRDIASIVEQRTYALGEFVFKQGEPADAMYALTKGAVRLVRQMEAPVKLARRRRVVRELWALEIALGPYTGPGTAYHDHTALVMRASGWLARAYCN